MCDPAEDELGRAMDEAIDLAESKQRIAQQAEMALIAKAAQPPTTPFPQAVPQVPSVVRNVHYVAYGTPGGEFPAGKHRAAIITDVPEADGVAGALNTVSLCILNPTGFFFTQDVPYDPTGTKPGTWRWPERV